MVARHNLGIKLAWCVSTCPNFRPADQNHTHLYDSDDYDGLRSAVADINVGIVMEYALPVQPELAS